MNLLGIVNESVGRLDSYFPTAAEKLGPLYRLPPSAGLLAAAPLNVDTTTWAVLNQAECSLVFFPPGWKAMKNDIQAALLDILSVSVICGLSIGSLNVLFTGLWSNSSSAGPHSHR